LEIKTAGNAKDWEDGVPPYYLTQITHYMSVTGRAFADVAVFFRDTCTFADYRVMRDEEDIELVNEAVDTFWHDNVEADVMPALTGTGGEVAALTAMFGVGSDYRFDDSDTIKDAVAAYKDAAERERQAKGDKEKASATLASLVGDAKGIEYSGGRVTWVRTSRTNFDSKRFKVDHPDLWAEYAQSRTCNGGFRIKESA
jgi:predicted phage-related endonuclease